MKLLHIGQIKYFSFLGQNMDCGSEDPTQDKVCCLEDHITAEIPEDDYEDVLDNCEIFSNIGFRSVFRGTLTRKNLEI